MYTDIKLDEFTSIIDLCNKGNGKECSAYIDKARLFVSGEGTEIMLRFDDKALHRITIVKMYFNNTDIDYGTKILDLLKEYGKQNGYKTICLESVLVDEEYAFANKHGFKRKENGLESMGGYFGDYLLDI
jgi:hypothetical protein